MLEYPQGWRILMAGLAYFNVKPGDPVMIGSLLGGMPQQEAVLHLEVYCVDNP